MSRKKNSIRRAKLQRQKARARKNEAERVERAIQRMEKPEMFPVNLTTGSRYVRDSLIFGK